MELTAYLLPLRKWWWLILAATLVAAVSSFIATSTQVPLYQSRTSLLIGSSIEDPNPSSGELSLAQQLAAIYADIASRDAVRRATAEALGLTSLPQYSAQAIPNSQIIEIVVIDTNPERAQAVAQELSNQLISQSPTSTSPEEIERLGFINEQLNRIQAQIEETQAEIEEKQNELGDLTSALEIQETGNQIQALEAKLTTLQSNYAGLLSTTQEGATNTLTILEPANLPRNPVNQDSTILVLVASAIGFSLAALAAFGLEYIDKSIKTPDDATNIFNSPVIGYIPKMAEDDSVAPHVISHPNSAVTEAFRSLRINIEFAATDNPLKTLFITSVDASAGKTTTSVNLAIMLAKAGHKVFLIDADLRRPSIHDTLGLSNAVGLSNILQGEVEFRTVVHPWNVENLEVITAGKPPLNPGELLSSNRMDQALINANLLADYVVVDGPPILVADSAIIASKVDGVMVVVKPGKTSRDLAESFEEQIERVGTPVVGVIFNQIPRRNLGYYGNHWYYSPYYTSEYMAVDGQPNNNHGKSPGLLTGLFSGILGQTDKKEKSPKPVVAPKEVEKDPHNTSPLNPAILDGQPAPDAKPRPPKAKSILRWEDHDGGLKKLVLREGDNILIGRDRINDVTIHSRHVSRRHAVITWRKDRFEIADLGSTNGTMVNDQKIDKPVALKHEDRITLFDIELIFENLAGSPQKAEVGSGEENASETEGQISN